MRPPSREGRAEDRIRGLNRYSAVKKSVGAMPQPCLTLAFTETSSIVNPLGYRYGLHELMGQTQNGNEFTWAVRFVLQLPLSVDGAKGAKMTV